MPVGRSRLFVIALILVAAFTGSLAIRLQPIKYGWFLDGFDPYFHYYTVDYLVKQYAHNGLPGLFDFFHHIDKRFWYPEGRDFAHTTFAGIYFTHFFLYEFVRIFVRNLSLYSYCVIVPAVYGALIVIPIYLLVRLYARRELALLAAFASGLSSSFIERSSAGWFDDEPFAMLPALIAIYLLYDALRKGKFSKITASESITAGLLIGYSATIWGGARFFVGALAFPLLVLPFSRELLRKEGRSRILLVTLAYLATLALPSAIPRPGPKAWPLDPSMLLVAAGLLWVFFNVILREYGFSRRLSLISSLIIVIGISTAMPALGVGGHISERYLAAIIPWMKASEPLVASVAEHQTTSGIGIIYNYSFLLPFAIIGIGLLLARFRNDSVSTSLGLLLLAAMYVAYGFTRLQVHLSYVMPVAAAISLEELASRLDVGRAVSQYHKKHARRISKRWLYLGTLIVLAVLLGYYSIFVWAPQADRGAQIHASATVFLKYDVPDWREALSWMRKTLPSDTVVVSWWDYGYWISVMGNVTTVVDGATLNETKIALVAHMFMSDEKGSINLLRQLHGDYVLVFVTGRRLGTFGIGGKKVVLYQTGRQYGLGGDEGKFDWMIAIAGLQRSMYIGRDNLPTYYFWYNTTLGRMMPFKPAGFLQVDRATMRIVYLSPQYVPNSPYMQFPVYTYRLYYNETSSPFRLVFSSTAHEIVSGFFAQVLIYRVMG